MNYPGRPRSIPYEFGPMGGRLLRSVPNVSGVSSMRTRINFSAVRSVAALQRTYHPDQVVASVVTPAAEPEPSIELTNLQTIALLRMNRSSLCRGIATHLQNETQDKPSLFDYRALTAHELCYRPDGERWHSLTVKGMRLAEKLARSIARKAGIHIMIEGGNEGAWASYRCTCGNWISSYQRGQFTQSNAYRGWVKHVAAASPTCDAESA